MGDVLKRIRNFCVKHDQAAISLLIFVTCVVVYLANNDTFASNDNIPHTLLAFKWFSTGSLDFDAFRGSSTYSNPTDGLPYYFIESPSGHLVSTYPIGTALVTFPLYCFFYLYLKLSAFVETIFTGVPHSIPAVTSQEFNAIRVHYEKWAATLSTSFAVVMFYLAVRLKFGQVNAIFTTFIYAFATFTWVSSSQGLRQHTISNLIVTALLLCFLKANRAEGRDRWLLLLAAGMLSGFLPGVRVTSVFFTLAAIVYAIFAYRKEAIFLFLGLPTALFNAVWNGHYFGYSPKSLLVAGYERFSSKGFFNDQYIFTGDYWHDAQTLVMKLLIHLVSPNYGLFAFTPILLLSLVIIYHLYKRRAGKDEQMILCMFLACAAVTLNYAAYRSMTGGVGFYGTRYMTDNIPVLTFLLGYVFAEWVEIPYQKTGKLFTPFFSFFLTLTIFCTLIQVIGFFGHTRWGRAPYVLGANAERIWEWKDTQVQRHLNNIYYTLDPPPSVSKRKKYAKGLAGSIVQLTDQNNQPLPSPLPMKPKEEMIMKATLKNTGKSKWYGYETGLMGGDARIKARFFTPEGKRVKTSRDQLFVSGVVDPGEDGIALGEITAPKDPGTYRVEFTFFVQDVKGFPKSDKPPDYVMQIVVK